MELFSKKAAQALRLVNTQIEAGNWAECSGCHQEYRQSGLNTNGHCQDCAKREQETRERLKTILTPRALTLHTWGRFNVTEDNRTAYEAVRAFDSQTTSLYLYGDCGVGKSHLSSLIVRQGVERNLRSVIATEPSPMCRTIQSALMENADAEQRAINRYALASLMVLDDLGTEKITDYRLQVLYEVINGRDKGMLNGLVITSNYDLDALASRFNDDRISSRIGGMCQVIHIGGQDWRQGGAA